MRKERLPLKISGIARKPRYLLLRKSSQRSSIHLQPAYTTIFGDEENLGEWWTV